MFQSYLAEGKSTYLSQLDEELVGRMIALACKWLTDVAQVKTKRLTGVENSKEHPFGDWRGSIRGEYHAASRTWGMFCPVWHTGQAVKALVLAARQGDYVRRMEAARKGVEFIVDKQIWDRSDRDHGLLLAYEDSPDHVNSSAVMESLEGVLLFAEETSDEELWERVEAALLHTVEHCYQEGKGVFYDSYIPAKGGPLLPNRFHSHNNIGGRPLLEDAVLLRCYRKTGKERLRDVHMEISERLLMDELPAGNWMGYAPCRIDEELIHPRHNYWWGLPLLESYRESGKHQYLECALRCGEFNLKALRLDGGWFRNTSSDFKTDSFGHATSGSACASLFFTELYRTTEDEKWREASELAIAFCQSMQLHDVSDPNLEGVIVEKLLPPNGSDRSPYYIRDLGTIFTIQAACRYLEL